MSRLKKASNELILKQLKEDLEGEYAAITLYQKHIDIIDIPEIKNKLIEIRDEEKHHAQELQELIEKYSE